MQLILGSEAVRNTAFTNESGQVLYKTSHPKIVLGGTTTVYKTVPNKDLMDMRDQFGVVGEIDWRVLESSTFRIDGKETQTQEFFRRHGILGRKRSFTGPDGRPYRWNTLLRVVVLYRDNESNAEVARYHRATLGVIGAKRNPRLDIDPDVMHMLDLIVFTFVYVETLRMDREKSRRGGRSEPAESSADSSEEPSH